MTNAILLTDNRYSFVSIRFGHFATVTNRAANTREMISNAAAERRVAEMLAAGWVKVPC